MFKNEEKKDKVVYVLNGYAPSKLRYFNQRNNKKIRTVIMENCGEANNAKNINWLFKEKILENNPYAKILITSEQQLEYISKNKKLSKWYTEHSNQFISTKFNFNNLSYENNIDALSNKKIVNEWLRKFHTNFVSHTKIMKGSEYNKLTDTKKKKLVVKSIYGSGNSGALLSPTKVNPKEEYVVENVLKTTDTLKFYVCTTLITPGIFEYEKDVSLLITSEDHTNFIDTGYPHTHSDFSHYTELKDFMTVLSNMLGVSDGLFETEVAFDSKEGKFYLIDINPRWSTDHDCIKEKFGEIVGKNFDMLEYAYERKPFNHIVEKFLKKHKNYIGNMKYYASVFVDMNTNYVNLNENRTNK